MLFLYNSSVLLETQMDINKKHKIIIYYESSMIEPNQPTQKRDSMF